MGAILTNTLPLSCDGHGGRHNCQLRSRKLCDRRLRSCRFSQVAPPSGTGGSGCDKYEDGWDGMKRLIIINNNMLSSPVYGGTVAGACSPTYALYISILDWIAKVVVDEVKVVISEDQGKQFSG
ncbi:hypothetical protein E3N88_10259 [Mikania micrantha]|uniref:Uncharacterized protein n=1 Tax=Mikania micrantha TaxID=192012 RepID=A0A5N6PB47_9ASTR|nr:hypothetical protein E3N88_10259 [Mikania micrantha]